MSRLEQVLLATLVAFVLCQPMPAGAAEFCGVRLQASGCEGSAATATTLGCESDTGIKASPLSCCACQLHDLTGVQLGDQFASAPFAHVSGINPASLLFTGSGRLHLADVYTQAIHRLTRLNRDLASVSLRFGRLGPVHSLTLVTPDSSGILCAGEGPLRDADVPTAGHQA